MRENKLYYGWINLIIIWVENFLCTAPLFYAFGVIINDMAADVGMTMTVATGAYTVETVVYSLIAPLHGRFVIRFGTRPSFQVGLGLGALACLGFALLRRSVPVYYLLWIVPMSLCLRFSGAFCCQVTVSKWFLRHRGTALGIFFASGGIGGYVFTPLLTRLAAGYSWHSVWLFFAAAYAVSFLLMFFYRETPDAGSAELQPIPDSQSHHGPRRTTRDWTAGQALKNGGFYISLLFFILSQFLLYAVCNTGITYLSDSGISVSVAAGAVAMFSLVSIAGRLLAGGVADSLGTKAPILLGCLLSLAGMLLTGAVSSTAGVYLALTVSGLGYGFIIVAPINMLMDYFGSFDYADIVSWYSLIGGCAVSLLPVIFGHVYDSFASYDLVWTIGVVLSAVCLAAAFFIRPPGGYEAGSVSSKGVSK